MRNMFEKTMQNGLSLGMEKEFHFQTKTDKFTTYALMIETMCDEIYDYEREVQNLHPEYMKHVYRIEQSLCSARANILDMRDIVSDCERGNDA